MNGKRGTYIIFNPNVKLIDKKLFMDVQYKRKPTVYKNRKCGGGRVKGQFCIKSKLLPI